MVTQERLKEVLYYHPDSGDFIWLEQLSRRAPIGTQAGNLSKAGYIRITIEGVTYRGHRLAKFYVNGVWPSADVDHEDTVRHHNWWTNLRDATRSQNMCNQKGRMTSSTQMKNIWWDSERKRFQVHVDLHEKRHHIGRFKTLGTAVKARNAALFRIHGDFARVA